jgi:hypothetical protein
MEQTRLLMSLQLSSPVAWSLVTSVILWSMFLFCGFGVLSGTNPTTIVALALGAISVASAMFLILDLIQPYSGLFRVSPSAIQQTLEAIDKSRNHAEDHRGTATRPSRKQSSCRHLRSPSGESNDRLTSTPVPRPHCANSGLSILSRRRGRANGGSFLDLAQVLGFPCQPLLLRDPTPRWQVRQQKRPANAPEPLSEQSSTFLKIRACSVSQCC